MIQKLTSFCVTKSSLLLVAVHGLQLSICVPNKPEAIKIVSHAFIVLHRQYSNSKYLIKPSHRKACCQIFLVSLSSAKMCGFIQELPKYQYLQYQRLKLGLHLLPSASLPINASHRSSQPCHHVRLPCSSLNILHFLYFF